MSDQPAVPGTAPSEPDGGTAELSGGTARYSVPQAARRLGISERAVRKRISVGSLHAERDGAAWVVFLEGGTDAEPGGIGGGTEAGTAEPEGGTGRNQSAAVDRRDVRLAAAEAENALLRERLAELEADRDGWRQQAERLVDLMRADRVLQLQDGAVVDGGSAEPAHADDAAVGLADGPGRAVAPAVDADTLQDRIAAVGRFLRSLVPFP